MTASIEDFFFDTNQEVKFGIGGNLPHRHQDIKIQYVTFRLADSLPLAKRQELSLAIEKFKIDNPEPWDEAILKEFQDRFSPAVEQLLHNGYGCCILKRPEIRTLLTESIHHSEGKEYELLAYVIMPNHVHILLRPFDTIDIRKIIQAIKSVSAHKINHLLNRTGPIWQREYFDRIVRSRDQFKHYYNYILHNPKNLHEGEFAIYTNNPYGL